MNTGSLASAIDLIADNICGCDSTDPAEVRGALWVLYEHAVEEAVKRLQMEYEV